MRRLKMKRGLWMAAVMTLTLATSQGDVFAQKAPVYKDPGAPVASRVDDLLKRMTLAEKLAQITTVWLDKREIFDEKTQFVRAKAKARYPDGIGHFARPNDRAGLGSPLVVAFREPRETAELVNLIQKFAIEDTRLGIPVLFHEEGLHGYAARGATSFPQSIALASTWDRELIERVFTVVGREIRARGVHLVLAPVVDVARDPRWGRFEETYGEDPYLVSEMGVAAIFGFQGKALPLGEGRVFATLKHMTGHGQPESGTNVGPANLSQRLLREVFFPPFEQAVKRTNIMSVMASYNEIDGVPSHANDWLLNSVLRGEWGFKGGVVSDYGGIEDLERIHHVVPDLTKAAALALKSGVDFDLPDGESFANLSSALEAGLVSEKDIDRAVRRMLTIKVLAGLFEHPFADPGYAEEITDNAEARALAEEAARESVVLLKNDGMLPLDAKKLKSIAVIGPNAAVTRLGGYSNVPRRTINILQGIETKVVGKVKVLHHEGVRIEKPTPGGDWWTDQHELADRQQNLKSIGAAVKVARRADAIVLVIGGNNATSREGWSARHLGDRSELELVGEQQELADAMFALGKPVVVVLINGSPLAVNEIATKTNALVEGWYLGQEGGTAMADILFGDANPGGKLPVTIPRTVGQLPLLYNHKPSALRGYLFGSIEPLFPFGYGLSYTTFEVGEPKLSAATIGANQSVNVTVEVKNTGKVEGDEVVQLYVRDKVSSVTRPVKELKGFERVTLEPGKSRSVTFTLKPDAFQFWNKDMKRVIEPGEFEIMAGSNSVTLKSTILTVAP